MSATHPTASAPVAKPDNMFGICAAVGEDFGFNALWLRLALGVGLIVNMEATLVAYAVLGMIVLVSRLAAPNRKADAPVTAVEPVQAQRARAQDLDALELPRAA